MSAADPRPSAARCTCTHQAASHRRNGKGQRAQCTRPRLRLPDVRVGEGGGTVTRAERGLLLALFRWARRDGGLQHSGLYTWARRSPAESRWGITFCASEWEPGETVLLEIWRAGITARAYPVRSIAEAVDLVVALGIAPAQFSTAYRAGYNGCMVAHRRAAEHGWPSREVAELLPWADTELVRS